MITVFTPAARITCILLLLLVFCCNSRSMTPITEDWLVWEPAAETVTGEEDFQLHIMSTENSRGDFPLPSSRFLLSSILLLNSRLQFYHKHIHAGLLSETAMLSWWSRNVAVPSNYSLLGSWSIHYHCYYYYYCYHYYYCCCYNCLWCYFPPSRPNKASLDVSSVRTSVRSQNVSLIRVKFGV